MLFEQVREIIVEVLGVAAEDVKPDTYLIDDLGADSLDAVELAAAFEDRYNLELDDDEIIELETIEDMVQYLERNLREN